MPIHGEYRMQKMHTKLAVDCDVPEENCFIMDNGEVLALSENKHKWQEKSLQAMFILMAAGLVILVISYLRDRRILSEEGLVVVVVSINMKELKLLLVQILFLVDLSTCENLGI